MKKFIKIVAGDEEFKVICPKGFDSSRMIKNHGSGCAAFSFILRQTKPSMLLNIARLISHTYNIEKIKVLVINELGDEIPVRVSKHYYNTESDLTAKAKQTRNRRPNV